MNSVPGGAGEAEPEVPLSFRLDTYWKRPRGEAGPTSMSSRRLALPEVLELLLQQLTDDEYSMTRNGTVTTLVIDWSKVPEEVRDPFKFGVKR